MKRRTVLKTLPSIALLPAALKVSLIEADEHKSAPKAAAAGSKKTEIPDYAGRLQHSDGTVTNPDGTTQQGFKSHKQQFPAG